MFNEGEDIEEFPENYTDGDGYPNGDGNGYPDGNGDPNGDGNGYPNGDGDGYPNGDGNGDGILRVNCSYYAIKLSEDMFLSCFGARNISITLHNKSEYNNKLPNECTKEELEKEVLRQLKLSIPELNEMEQKFSKDSIFIPKIVQ